MHHEGAPERPLSPEREYCNLPSHTYVINSDPALPGPVSTVPKESIEDQSPRAVGQRQKIQKRTKIIILIVLILVIIGAVLGGVLGSRAARKVKLPTRKSLIVTSAGQWANGTGKSGWNIYHSERGTILRTYATQYQPKLSKEGPGEEIKGHWIQQEERRPRTNPSSPLAQCEIPGKVGYLLVFSLLLENQSLTSMIRGPPCFMSPRNIPSMGFGFQLFPTSQSTITHPKT